jgi:hypothetical protein
MLGVPAQGVTTMPRYVARSFRGGAPGVIDDPPPSRGLMAETRTTPPDDRPLLRRAAATVWPLLQQTAAAVAAWLIALAVIDHPVPFFAPTAAVVALNATWDGEARTPCASSWAWAWGS